MEVDAYHGRLQMLLRKLEKGPDEVSGTEGNWLRLMERHNLLLFVDQVTDMLLELIDGRA